MCDPNCLLDAHQGEGCEIVGSNEPWGGGELGLVLGDGAWGMSLAEVLTCVRENIPTVAVVFNNGQWGAEKKNQVDYYDDRYVGTNLENPSFAGIAKAMGADGVKVSHAGEVGDALREAAASSRCTVLEIMVGQDLAEPFRRDALAKPVRLLDKYKNFTVR